MCDTRGRAQALRYDSRSGGAPPTSVAQAFRPAAHVAQGFSPASCCRRNSPVRTLGALSVCIAIVLWVSAPLLHAQQQPKPTAAQEEFVPVEDLPPQDALPAAPLLITAYAAAWVLILLYLWSIWRRLSRVEGEMAALRQRIDTSPRGVRH